MKYGGSMKFYVLRVNSGLLILMNPDKFPNTNESDVGIIRISDLFDSHQMRLKFFFRSSQMRLD